MSEVYHSLGLNMHQPLGNLIALHNSDERWEAKTDPVVLRSPYPHVGKL
jgi:hypothetical protein